MITTIQHSFDLGGEGWCSAHQAYCNERLTPQFKVGDRVRTHRPDQTVEGVIECRHLSEWRIRLDNGGHCWSGPYPLELVDDLFTEGRS